MQIRSSSKFIGESSTNPKRRNRRRSKQRVEPIPLEEVPVVMMADQRTMVELLYAPTEGYAEAIVVPLILAKHFKLKHSLINLVTSKQFFGFEKEDPHAYIRYFNKITSTLKYKDVPETSIKLMLFPFSIDGGNLLERSTQDDLKIIENKSRVWNSRNKLIVSQVKESNVDSSKMAKLTNAVTQCPATNGNTFTGYHDNIQGYVSATAEDLKAITTQSGVTLARPLVSPPPPPSKEVDQEPETIEDQIPESNLHQPSIPYPSRLNKEKLQGKDDIQIHYFLQMFKKIHFNISFFEALAHMPKFAKMVKDLLTNKEKLLEVANTPVNENCTAVILKKLLEKLRDARSPTLTPDPMVESLSPSLNPFGDSDFLLEETDAFLSLDDLIPPGIDDGTYDSEGDILFHERLLNNDPTPDLPSIPHPACLINDAKKIKSFIDDPPNLELKELPSHLEYAFLEGTSKLPCQDHFGSLD
nr:reverse transcriptase domain-containing protein [Tanacetum cinerariifolium]